MGSGPDFARIGIGAASTVLTSDGTDAAWAAPAAPTEESDQFILAGQIFG
jgi:hypothetical protein